MVLGDVDGPLDGLNRLIAEKREFPSWTLSGESPGDGIHLRR